MKKIFQTFLAIIIFTLSAQKARALVVSSVMWGVGTAIPVAKALIIGGAAATVTGGGSMIYAIRGIMYNGESALFRPVFLTGFSVGVIGVVLDDNNDYENLVDFDETKKYLEENLYSNDESQVILQDLIKMENHLSVARIFPYHQLKDLSATQKIDFIKSNLPFGTSDLTVRFILESATTLLDR